MMFYLASIIFFIQLNVTEHAVIGPFNSVYECESHKAQLKTFYVDQELFKIYKLDCIRQQEVYLHD